MIASSLAEYMASKRPAGFKTEARYFCEGDFIAYFAENDLFVAERIDDRLTVYRSELSGKMIGFKLKGAKLIQERLGDFAIEVVDDKVKLGPLVCTAAMIASEDHRKQYHALARAHGTVVVNMPPVRKAA